MRASRIALFAALGVCVGFAVAIIVHTCRARALDDQRRCQSWLRALWYTCHLYEQDCGHPPETLEALVKGDYVEGPGALECGQWRTWGQPYVPGLWHRYLYVPWWQIDPDVGFLDQYMSARDSLPSPEQGRLPFIYDSHLANHDGRGINIITLDGTKIWDPKAEWLQKFASEHPDYSIPLPLELRERGLPAQRPVQAGKAAEAPIEDGPRRPEAAPRRTPTSEEEGKDED